MWEQILRWVGGIFAGIGVIFLFFDIINCIRKRNRRALNIAGLVVLGIGVVGYLITDIILPEGTWPPIASLIWIALFWVYVILIAIETFGDIKVHRRNKRAEKNCQSNDSDTENPPQDKQN